MTQQTDYKQKCLDIYYAGDVVDKTLSFGCEVIGGAFSKKMIYHFYGADTSDYGAGYYGHHLIYPEKKGASFQSDYILDKNIIGHPPTLASWLRLMRNGYQIRYGAPDLLSWMSMENEVVYFNLTTEEPTDWEALHNIIK